MKKLWFEILEALVDEPRAQVRYVGWYYVIILPHEGEGDTAAYYRRNALKTRFEELGIRAGFTGYGYSLTVDIPDDYLLPHGQRPRPCVSSHLHH